jgi:prephenate dehydratase
VRIEKLTFATQGNEFSWHAQAARVAAGTSDIDIIDCDDFRDVITASINEDPGLGVMAINTAFGTVERSARRMVGRRAAALAPVVARVDLEIGLSLIGSKEQTLEELNRRGVVCYLQEEAQLQIDGFKRAHLPWLSYVRRNESTHAVQEALDKKSPDHVAVGPSYSAELMGGFVLGPKQINPEGSVTSFYILQRDPSQKILPAVKPRTKVSVIGINYPDVQGEFEKCLDAMNKVGIEPVRYIPYRTGHTTRHNPNITKNGGILEVQHPLYDSRVTKLCGKINALGGEDGVVGPFDAKKLGEYKWPKQKVLDLDELLKD